MFTGAVVGCTTGRLLAALHVHNTILAFIIGGVVVIPFAYLLKLWVSPTE